MGKTVAERDIAFRCLVCHQTFKKRFTSAKEKANECERGEGTTSDFECQPNFSFVKFVCWLIKLRCSSSSRCRHSVSCRRSASIWILNESTSFFCPSNVNYCCGSTQTCQGTAKHLRPLLFLIDYQKPFYSRNNATLNGNVNAFSHKNII